MQMEVMAKEFKPQQLFGHASNLKANCFKEYVENSVNKTMPKTGHLQK